VDINSCNSIEDKDISKLGKSLSDFEKLTNLSFEIGYENKIYIKLRINVLNFDILKKQLLFISFYF
jgi:hypothetical protein